MKICDLALFSLSSGSGVRTYITSKIGYVSRHPQIDHVVIVPGPADCTITHGRSKLIVVRGIPSSYPGIRLGINIGRIAKLIERESPDLIELNCQYTLPWAAFLATRRRRIPIVGIYHTDVPACARHWARNAGTAIASSVERLVASYEGLIYRHCTVTIALNAGMRDRVKQCLGVRRIRCLPCGVDATVFHPARRDPTFRSRLRIEPDQTAIFYAGRLSPEKELDVLFAAFERLPPRKFVLIVAGDGPGAGEVRRYAAARSNVRYLGHIESRADIALAYASSDLFVIPGRHETFGMATLEALASGLPVVGILGSGTMAVVPPHLGMLVKPGDVAELGEAISMVARETSAAMSDACHAFASRTFSWDSVFDQYFRLYRELVGDRAPAGAEG